MQTIKATHLCLKPPQWALLQRHLITLMNEAIIPYVERYTREDGSLIWADTWPDTRDGLDDFYEAFTNFPLLYMLGGQPELLELALKSYDAITKQAANMGRYSPVHDNYERGYDQFHQSEGYLFFYLLCMADPQNDHLRALAEKYAGFFTGENPDAPNYDADKNILRAPHNGSKGPRWGYIGSDDTAYHWNANMKRYGLPYDDVEGITTYDDLKAPELAQRMGDVMETRMGRGDVANNLLVSGLIANAYFLTGDTKYANWLKTYVDGWVARAEANGGLLPDNVGLSGTVGEYMDGRWYGAAYGWTWPHGFYNINMAALVSGIHAYYLTGDESYLDLPRIQLDKIFTLGKTATFDRSQMSLPELSAGFDPEKETFLIPMRYSDSGWFDYHPPDAQHLITLWHLTHSDKDRERIEQLRAKSSKDWAKVVSQHNKEDRTNDRAWFAYLQGDNADFPTQALEAAIEQVNRRVALIATDDADLSQVNIHHWQNHNPITTETLVQLTLGAPQMLYYGGSLITNLFYFQADSNRPGLPDEVSALVEKVDDNGVTVHLVNLSASRTHTLIIQGGALGEHRITTITYTVTDEEATTMIDSGANKRPLNTTAVKQTITVGDVRVQLEMPALTQIRLDIGLKRYVNPPRYISISAQEH